MEKGWLLRALPCKIIKYGLGGTSSIEHLILCEYSNEKKVEKPYGAKRMEQKNGTLYLLPLKTLLENRNNEDVIKDEECENKYAIPRETMDASDCVTNLNEF